LGFSAKPEHLQLKEMTFAKLNLSGGRGGGGGGGG